MKLHRNGSRKGFSLVELLAVVLVLAVLAAVAVPLYLNTRKTSAARTCKANIAAIASAQSAFATRYGAFCKDSGGSQWESAYNSTSGSATSGGLLGAPEGLAEVPTCPLKGLHYTCKPNGTTAAAVDILCSDAAQHVIDNPGTTTANWTKTLQPSGSDTTNPL